MKAYHCWEETENCGTIIFAESAGKARYIAMTTDSLGDDLEFRDVRVRRVPQLDEYYRGLREMDWFDDNDRIAMVRYAGFSCWECAEYEDCEKCRAKEWCSTYERMKEW